MPHKTTLIIPNDVWFPFKLKAAKEYTFEKGYTSKAATNAMRMWIELDNTHEKYNDLIEIERKKHPDYKDEELVESVFKEAKGLYLKKNKNYL